MSQKSFSEVAELLSKKESKYQKMLDSAVSKRDKTTAQRMLDRVTQSKESLIADNRASAEKKNPTGGIPQYGLGADVLSGLLNTDPPGKKLNLTQGVDELGFLRGLFKGNEGPNYDIANKFKLPEFNLQGGASRPELKSVFPNDITARGIDLGNAVKRTDPASIADSLKSTMGNLNNNEQDGGLLNKLKGLLNKQNGEGGGLLGMAGKAAPFMDNLAMKKYINQVKGDSMPEMNTSPMLNTRFNINPQLAEAKRSARVFDKSMDGSATNRSTARNAKIAGQSQRLNALNKLFGRKENVETQLKNNAAQVYNATNNSNTALRNQHAQNNVDFNNQKEYMKYANILNMSEDVGNINSQRIEQQNQQNMLDVLRPYFNRFGIMDKVTPQYSSKKTKSTKKTKNKG